MQQLVQLLAGLSVAGITGILWLHTASAYLHAEVVRLQTLPALLPIYYRVLLSLLLKPRKLKPQRQLLPARCITTGPVADSKTLAAFYTISCVQPAADMPLLFPSVLAFRLNMACMAAPSFPISVLGGVLSGYRAIQHRPFYAAERLAFRLTLQPQLRTTAAGHTEFDIAIAASIASGDTVWSDCSTFTIASGSRNRAPQQATAPEDSASHIAWRDLATWDLQSGVGRQFAALNGDINPIHIAAWSAKIFGFRSNIAHGMLLLARAVAAAEANGDMALYPRAISASFKRPVFLPDHVRCWVREAGVAAGAPHHVDWPQQFSRRMDFAITRAAEGVQKENVVGQLAWGAQAHKL